MKHSNAGQIRPSADKVVVVACENCRSQIGDLNAHYNLNVEITALADLVVKVMRLPNAAAPDESISVKSHTGRHRGTRLESGLAQAVEWGVGARVGGWMVGVSVAFATQPTRIVRMASR